MADPRLSTRVAAPSCGTVEAAEGPCCRVFLEAACDRKTEEVGASCRSLTVVVAEVVAFLTKTYQLLAGEENRS